MLYLRNKPIGIDKQISHLQEWLYDNLTSLGWTDYDCYGRAYLNKNPRDNKNNVFEISLNSKDYKEITFDDKHNATSFFYLKDNHVNELSEATVVLIFSLNLKKLFNNSLDRRDEEAVMEITSILHVNPPSFKLTKINRITNDVYKDFTIDAQDRDNMSENFVCSFEMTVNYIHELC